MRGDRQIGVTQKVSGVDTGCIFPPRCRPVRFRVRVRVRVKARVRNENENTFKKVGN